MKYKFQILCGLLIVLSFFYGRDHYLLRNQLQNERNFRICVAVRSAYPREGAPVDGCASKYELKTLSFDDYQE